MHNQYSFSGTRNQDKQIQTLLVSLGTQQEQLHNFTTTQLDKYATTQVHNYTVTKLHNYVQLQNYIPSQLHN